MNYIITTSEGEALLHYGIIGQRWGIRRYQNPDGTLTEAGKKRYYDPTVIRSNKTKEMITLLERKPHGLGKLSNKSDNEHDIVAYIEGKKIADMWLEDQGDTLYINWIGTVDTERGKGYASSLMDYIITYGNKNDFKSITLEVPGNSPDARHIYEKKGFVEDTSHPNYSKMTEHDDIWEGLTPMKKQLK